MRTTLAIDDDVIEIAKVYASDRNLSLGAAVSDLVRQGAEAPLRTKLVDGLHIADLPPDSPIVTMEHIQSLDDEL